MVLCSERHEDIKQMCTDVKSILCGNWVCEKVVCVRVCECGSDTLARVGMESCCL